MKKLIFIGLSSNRLRNACRKVYIVFDAHPISGVFFVCLKYFSLANVWLYAPVGVLFCFS